jgi:hypothetical protein
MERGQMGFFWPVSLGLSLLFRGLARKLEKENNRKRKGDKGWKGDL